MKENLKSLAWFLAVLFILSVGAELMAEDYNGMPAIKDFEIVKDGEDLNFSFSFDNINGGLAEAKFTVGYVIERNGLVMESNIMTNLSVAPDLGKASELKIDVFETGKFQMIVPWFEAKGIAELKSGDTITYVIFLKDSTGRKSNTISYEYEFVGGWDI